MLVAVDKFTNWVEAAPVTTQDSKAAINFIKSIVFRFGVPHSIITDNGTNFTSKEFKDYCEGLGIKLRFASVQDDVNALNEARDVALTRATQYQQNLQHYHSS
jgi:hypothetical protein